MNVAAQFVSFGLIGTAAFLVDTGVLYAALALGIGPYLGRLLSYLVAATFTWALNRRFTFRSHASTHRLREWGRFLAANAVGGTLNYGTYSLLMLSSTLVASWPVLGVAAGSLVGMCSNFLMSRHLVFRRTHP